MKKGKEKRRKITLKKGKKALKMPLLGYKLKKISPPPLPSGKILNLKRGVGGGK